MKNVVSFKGVIEKFPGPGGWHYVAVHSKYTKGLKQKRKVWGMYPIIAHVGNTFWKTKLMMKKGGDFFLAIKSDIRNKEKLAIGDRVSIYFELK